MRPSGAAIALLVLLSAASCAPSPGGGGCLLASQRPLVSVTLFFGRAIPGRAPLRQEEWEAFVTATLAPNFPDGFTVIDGTGRWRDRRSGAAESEATKIVEVIAPPGADLAGRVANVADTYRRMFRQVAVGVTSQGLCAAF